MYLDRLEYKKDFLLPLDGRCRFVSAVLLIIAAVSATSVLTLSVIIIFCVLLLAREPRITLLRLSAVNVMSAAVWITVLFGFSAKSAAIYTLRINSAALLYMVFIIPMNISVIASSMTMLGIPKKLTSLFILTYRYIFLMSEHLSSALTAMRLRCPGGGTARLWRSFAAVFAATTASAIFRSQRISWAMVSRGFNGAFPVTHTFRWRTHDTAVLALSLAVSILIILNGTGLKSAFLA
ncbi:MAG: energy-coupling factor transporter transmembrane protein EcfT [Spirochaetaceae bacterium]|jgi:cobalt/nickel transport system permease protein|nr:energy-coupling factor transporter transmembrane protein EcfT [Spirochaetaceae bacterium]